MAENIVKVDISFQSLLEAISSLWIAEKHQLWELLEAELFPNNEDSPEEIAEIQAARADYEAGDYLLARQIRLQLSASGTPIGPNDVLIAAIALTNNLTLVTHNTQEFDRVPGLTVEDWESPSGGAVELWP